MKTHGRLYQHSLDALVLTAALAALGLGCRSDHDEQRFRVVPGNGDGDADGDADADDHDEAEAFGAKQLAAGGRFTCVLQHDGAVSCWGENQYGQLGQGHIEALGDDELPNAAGPIDIGGPASSIAVGRDHACALRTDGRLLCWGSSQEGVLGYGDLDIIGNNELPSDAGPVDVGAAVRSVHAGPKHTCAITLDAELLCWGYNRVGQLGYGHTNDIGDDEAPISAGAVKLGAPVVDVAMSWGNTCAVLEGGDVHCWGQGSDGELGAGYIVGEDIGDDELPLSLPPLKLGGPAQAIEAGWDHFCALLEGGDLVCWGSNEASQLGYGIFEEVGNVGDDETPASMGPVPLGEPAIGLALGLNHSCAIGKSGAAYCWGGWSLYGDEPWLGYPELEQDLVPMDAGPIELPGPVDELAAGDSHTCARIGPDIYCWGSGYSGALGYAELDAIGDDEPPASGGPVQFAGGKGNGGVPPIPDKLDGEPDAVIRMTLQAKQPPKALSKGSIVHARGSNWSAFECEGCSDSWVIRAADDKTIVLASLDGSEQLHPERGILNIIGLEPETWLAPLKLEVLDLGLCPQLVSEQDPACVGTRLSLDIEYPQYQSARLLDDSRGHVGGGYMVSVQGLQDWSAPACMWVEDMSHLWVDIIRQDCAPNCGPVEVIDACEPPQQDFDYVRMGFIGAKMPRDPGFDVTCEVVEVGFNEEWEIYLDCLGLP